jgi:hypothetical protein
VAYCQIGLPGGGSGCPSNQTPCHRPTNLLDALISRPDERARHEVTIQAPAAMVFETACNFDLQYIWMVRAIF